jgi:signal transduction histidine kinase
MRVELREPFLRRHRASLPARSGVGSGSTSTPRKTADLYGLPLEEFTRARDELARELRKAGNREAADEVKALPKPSVSAWAVNQLARRHPQELKALVQAGEALRKAQRSAVTRGDSAGLREAQRAHRERLDELLSTARHDLRTSGQTLQRVAQTLRAASVEKEASKALAAGTLTEDVSQSGFGGMLVAIPGGKAPAGRRPPERKATTKATRKPPAKPKPAPKPKPDPNAAKRRRLRDQLEKARARVAELEAQLDELGPER